MRLYYFTNEHYGIKAILTQRLKVSRFDLLNDPFELLALKLPEKGWRQQNHKIKKQVAEKFGLICMCRTWKNPLLWSHYADHHKGICLGFDVSEAAFKKVCYRSERLECKELGISSSGELKGNHFDEIIYNKFDNWAYEEEHRAKIDLSTATLESGLSFLPFSADMILKEVLIGARCNLGHEAVDKLLEQYGSAVKATKVRPAFNTFDMVEKTDWRTQQTASVARINRKP